MSDKDNICQVRGIGDTSKEGDPHIESFSEYLSKYSNYQS